MTETFTFEDILLKPKASSRVKSRSQTDISTSFYGIHLNLPIISASMSLFDTPRPGSHAATWAFAKTLSDLGGMHIFSRGIEYYERFRAASTLGEAGSLVGIAVSWDEFQRRRSDLEDIPAFVSIDIANGSIIQDVDWEGLYPLIVGNFGNPGVVLRDDFLGDIIFKLGIGSGAGCTTRVVTGVGAPQGWLINETAKISQRPLISDGGVSEIADFVKALALGADAVMLGRLLAGAYETPWEPVKINNKWYKPYRGMASAEEKGHTSHVEGVSGYVPYEEKMLEDILQELVDGLRSAMAYNDSFTLTEFMAKAEFLHTHSRKENGTRLYHG